MDVEDASRQSGFSKPVCHKKRRGRVPFGWLQNEGVPSCKGDWKHPHRNHTGKVERRDANANAKWLPDHVAVYIRSDIFRELTFHERRCAGCELNHFKSASYLAKRIIMGLAMFG